MAGYSFSSLKDILKDQTESQKTKFKGSSSSPKKLYEHPSAISTRDLFPSAPPPPPSWPNPSLETTVGKLSGHDNNEKLPMAEDECMYPNNLCKGDQRLFPPPLSCLKLVKTGKPFVYFKFDKNLGRFVPDQINILPRGVMRVSRENGRMKMRFASDVLEEEEEEEEEEIEEEMVHSEEEEG